MNRFVKIKPDVIIDVAEVRHLSIEITEYQLDVFYKGIRDPIVINFADNGKCETAFAQIGAAMDAQTKNHFICAGDKIVNITEVRQVEKLDGETTQPPQQALNVAFKGKHYFSIIVCYKNIPEPVRIDFGFDGQKDRDEAYDRLVTALDIA